MNFPWCMVWSFGGFLPQELWAAGCWHYNPYLSTKHCITQIWWSTQWGSVDLTGFLPPSYILNSSFISWYKFLSFCVLLTNFCRDWINAVMICQLGSRLGEEEKGRHVVTTQVLLSVLKCQCLLTKFCL